jgi:acyl carrier protein
VLEHELLAFIKKSLLRDGATVDADSRLFEDGFIDSIRVLELIAFVERATARKVPDRLVRLSTFRSVRAIVATFGGSPAGEAQEQESERLHEYRAHHEHMTSPLPELKARNELVVLGDGRLALAGMTRDLFDFFDATFGRWAAESGAAPRDLPSRIPLATLARAGFTTAFPQLLVTADHEDALTPAACYHCYPERAGQTLRGDVITSVRAICHRRETDTAPLERQREFTMCEIVCFGSRQSVERWRQQLVERVGRFVSSLALDGAVEAANDPFFTAASDGRRLAQRAGALKLELRLSLDGGRSLAVASFNHHLDHFGSRFGISVADGTPAHSGCVAFGLERWVLAFLTQHGLEQATWPADVRGWLSSRRLDARSA